MTVPRSSPYMYGTWPTKYLTGDKSCLWACWFKTHYQNYEKAPSDFDLARWQAEHTVLVNSLADELERQGCKVWIEHQNSFKVESRKSGLTVSGRPDLIAKFPDGRTVIYDAKTGRESSSHLLQVQLYMYLLPEAAEARAGTARSSRALWCMRTATRSVFRLRASTVHSSSAWRTSCRRWRLTCRRVVCRASSSAVSAI